MLTLRRQVCQVLQMCRRLSILFERLLSDSSVAFYMCPHLNTRKHMLSVARKSSWARGCIFISWNASVLHANKHAAALFQFHGLNSHLHTYTFSNSAMQMLPHRRSLHRSGWVAYLKSSGHLPLPLNCSCICLNCSLVFFIFCLQGCLKSEKNNNKKNMTVAASR